MINTFISPYVIAIPIIVMALIVVFIVLNNLKKGKQLNSVISSLIENNYQIKEKNAGKREIIACHNDDTFAIKLISGGKNKGLVITNKDTYFMRLYKDANSSHIDSWLLDDVKTFINLYKKEQRVIIVMGGYARITKYINENELEAVTLKNDAFGTKVLSLEDFRKYIER